MRILYCFGSSCSTGSSGCLTAGFAENEAIGARIRELGIGDVKSQQDIIDQGLDDTSPLLSEIKERFDSPPPQFTGTGSRTITGTVMEYLG